MDINEKQKFFDSFNKDEVDIINYLKTLPDNKERLEYLYKWKTNRLHVYSFKDKIKHFYPEGDERWDEKQLDVALEYVELEIEHLEKLEKLGTRSEVPKLKKIKWNGTPSQFGYLFTELIKQGFIEPPLYNGEMNISGFSRLCWECFDINTTPQNLEKECNPNKNDLSETKRAKFTIPNLSDLA
jgi:hypothetical protein